MGQLVYYLPLLWFVGRYVVEYPWLSCGALLAFLAIRRWLPDPYVYARTSRRLRQLRSQITQNPDNATARRDLALVLLERRRPRKALPLLLEARRRAPDSAELAYLTAVAYVRTKQHEQALPLCIEAAAREPKLRYGEVYLMAGIALAALRRDEEAEDAFLRLLAINSSSVEGWVRLARLRARMGDATGAAKARQGAVEAFDASPSFRRRRELGWYLRARLAV